MDTSVVVALLVGAALVAIVVPYLFRAPGRALRKRFVALGSLKGRTRREIEKAVGPAAQETELPEGKILLQSEGAEIFIRRVELQPVGR